MSTALLATKLYLPLVRPEWAPRPHLVERLDARRLEAARRAEELGLV